MTNEEQLINDTVTASSAHAQIKSNASRRATFTMRIRSLIFSSLGVCSAFFALVGVYGVRFLLKSQTSVADANTQHVFDNMNPAESMFIAGRYGELLVVNAAEVYTVAEIMAQMTYWSKVLNDHADTPYSSEPEFQLSIQDDASVAVAEKVEVAE